MRVQSSSHLGCLYSFHLIPHDKGFLIWVSNTFTSGDFFIHVVAYSSPRAYLCWYNWFPTFCSEFVLKRIKSCFKNIDRKISLLMFFLVVRDSLRCKHFLDVRGVFCCFTSILQPPWCRKFWNRTSWNSTGMNPLGSEVWNKVKFWNRMKYFTDTSCLCETPNLVVF